MEATFSEFISEPQRGRVNAETSTTKTQSRIFRKPGIIDRLMIRTFIAV